MRRVVGPSGRAPTMLISCFPSVETAEADMPPQDRDENCDVDQGSVPTGLQSMDSGKDSAHHWPDGATRSSGSLASVVSLTIVPCALIAQIAVLASETSNPIYTSMSLSFLLWTSWGAAQHGPVDTPHSAQGAKTPHIKRPQSTHDDARRAKPCYGICYVSSRVSRGGGTRKTDRGGSASYVDGSNAHSAPGKQSTLEAATAMLPAMYL